MSSQTVAPFHSVRNCRPDKNCGSAGHPILLESCRTYPLCRSGIPIFDQKLVFDRQVSIEARIQTIHIEGAQIRFKSTSGSSRGYSPASVAGTQLLPYSLCCP